MRVFYLSIMLFSILFIQPASSETVTIQDCDDISLLNTAYANDKFPAYWKKGDSDTLMINYWMC